MTAIRDRRLCEVVRCAARAASAHNSQPWAVSEGDGALDLRLDRERALGPSDPDGRDTVLSLGSFVETLLICASSAGVGLRFVPSPNTGDGVVGRFERVPESYATPFDWTDVLRRRVWRGGWVDGAPSNEDLEELVAPMRPTGFRFATISTKDARPLLARANRWFFGDPQIVAELHRWARLTPRHSAYGRDGLNDVMLVLSKSERALLRALIHPMAHAAFRRLGAVELLARTSTAAVRGDGVALGVIGTTREAAGLEAGRLLTRLWLRLQQEGLHVHPQSLLLDCPETRAALNERWQVSKDEKIFSWFRVGIPSSDPGARARHPRRLW